MDGEQAKGPQNHNGEPQGSDKHDNGEDPQKWPSWIESCVDQDLQRAERDGSLVSTFVSAVCHVWLQYDTKDGLSCQLCHRKVKDATVLSFDNSWGEYRVISLCERCITKLASKFRAIAREKLAMPEDGAVKPDAVADQA
jgi:hypothetical protein